MSTFGRLYRVTTSGESHCKQITVIIDGTPPKLEICEDDIMKQLKRRRPGQSAITTPRNEKDVAIIQSGVEHGLTLGSPICVTVANQDYKATDYLNFDGCPRPSHADWTYLKKYGIKSASGGGRSSARETIGRVCAAAIAEKYLKKACGIEIVAFVESVCRENIDIAPKFPEILNEDSSAQWKLKCKSFWEFLDTITREEVDKNEVRCPNEEVASRIRNQIMNAKQRNVSVGGTVMCVIRNVPPGLGEPCFDKLEAQLASAMLSIPASKSFEIGSGLECSVIPANFHNDLFFYDEKKKTLRTKTNFSGGIQGGISNGENIYFRVAFKPAPTIGLPQETANYSGNPSTLEAAGRHDPCVLPRAVPIVESMATLVIMDSLLMQYQREACLRHTETSK